MTTIKHTHQHVRNYLLRNKLAVAFEKGDMAAAQKIARLFDQQQLQEVRKALHRRCRAE